MTIEQLSMAIVAILSPFSSYLIESGKTLGEEFIKTIAKHSGESAWSKAKELWRKLQSKSKNNDELESALKLVAVKPDVDSRKIMFAEVLAFHLKEDSELAGELLDFIGGEKAVQEILADKDSWIEDAIQQMNGQGRQSIQVKENSVGKGIRQIMIKK